MRISGGQLARALRRNRGLTAAMVLGLGSGIALWQLSSLSWREQRQTAVADSESLFAIALRRDSAALEPFPDQPGLTLLLDTLLTHRDAAALTRPDLATRVVPTTAGMLAVAPESRAPEEKAARFAGAGLFAMFALGFEFGGPYRDGAAEVVLDHHLNRRWFGGRNSVGETIRIGSRAFRVAGVLAAERWMRNFDLFVPRPEGLFFPMEAFRELRAWPDPSGATANPGRFFSHPDAAEEAFVRVWLDVPPAALDTYQRFLDAWVHDGERRFPALVSARLVPWSEWRKTTVRGDGVYDIVHAMGALILAGCTLNLVRIAMVLFGARSLELGVRRAMGESRRAVLRRQLREAAAVGACAGALGLVVLVGFVPIFNAIIPVRPLDFFVDAQAVAACLLGGPLAAMLAALYPAWKFSRLAPAALLRRQ